MDKISNKELIEKALHGIKNKVFIAMTSKHKVPKKTIETAIRRGSFSKKLSYLMEDVTLKSSLFWQNPKKFDQSGHRK